MIDDAYNINGRSVIVGDCRSILPTLPDNYFDCIVTSPPYWGLRDYGVKGQIGLEPTLNEYLETMVGVCRELRRVLKPEGTFWLNIGDRYIDKSILMLPNKVAIALRDDGWFVRSEIIWFKPNAMSDRAINRPTSAHEKVWLLTKSGQYFYDLESIREDIKPSNTGVISAPKMDGFRGKRLTGGARQQNVKIYTEIKGANRRNVWPINVKPFKGAHFATMPPELAERCIKAGCPEGGIVLDPFGGAGTTAMVAKQLGRRALSIELNPEYAVMIEQRAAAAALKETE